MSFKRPRPYDWSEYTHMLIRCRGDGRPYHLILHMDRYFDIQWHDQYHYPLFTHGGPYWQMAKVRTYIATHTTMKHVLWCMAKWSKICYNAWINETRCAMIRAVIEKHFVIPVYRETLSEWYWYADNSDNSAKKSHQDTYYDRHKYTMSFIKLILNGVDEQWQTYYVNCW